MNKGDSSISDIVNHCVCVYLIYEKHSSSIFVTLNQWRPSIAENQIVISG